VDLVAVPSEEVAALRTEKLGSFPVRLLPGFHVHLAHSSQAYAVVDGAGTVGYILLLAEHHEGHDHTTLIEAYLTPPYRDRYEEVVELVRARFEPQTFLARSDDCTFTTALIAEGLPMEASMAVLVARAVYAPVANDELQLVPLDYAYLQAAHDLYVHARGVEQAPTYAELEAEMAGDRVAVLTLRGEPVALVVQEQSQSPGYRLFDIMAPHVAEEAQVWALQTAGVAAEKEGLTGGAVIDARDTERLRVFRAAGYYTAASYLLFYDAEAGRPSVPTIERERLRQMIEAGETFHLVDVLGEEHWKKGHLPGATWMDFRSLTREARRRFKKDERIVVYCDSFT
jgi:Rhodanese-like domain.